MFLGSNAFQYSLGRPKKAPKRHQKSSNTFKKGSKHLPPKYYILDHFWDHFGNHFGAKKCSKIRPGTLPRTLPRSYLGLLRAILSHLGAILETRAFKIAPARFARDPMSPSLPILGSILGPQIGIFFVIFGGIFRTSF